jgi:DNA-binding MarR family transcriptional regulator
MEQARLIQRHAQLMRTYVLRGESPASAWEGLPKDPTLPQVRAMLALHVLGSCRLKTLARRLDISDPAASEMVERLVEMGLVSREQDPTDRRQVVLSLTEEAANRVQTHEDFMLRKIVRLMERLGEQSVEQWTALAQETISILEAESEGSHE